MDNMDDREGNNPIIIYITASNDKEAEKIARELVGNRLVACCNIIPAIRSIYRWKGDIHDDREVLLISKTVSSLFPSIIDYVKRIHSYEVPEIIAVPIIEGEKNYINWIQDNISNSK